MTYPKCTHFLKSVQVNMTIMCSFEHIIFVFGMFLVTFGSKINIQVYDFLFIKDFIDLSELIILAEQKIHDLFPGRRL